MLEALKAYGKVERINFNLPTLSPQKFQQMTGSKLYLQSVNNIKRAIQMGFNCYIIVNGTKQEICENLSAMQNFFGADMKDRIISFGTVDRAGNLKNKYFLNLHYTKQLRGCTHGIRWLSIDIDGDCITCCMDFKKENTFGNIRNQSIQEMLQDTKAVTLRKKIFGAQYSEADFICRRCLDCKQAVRFWNYSKDFAPVYNFSQSFGRKVLK